MSENSIYRHLGSLEKYISKFISKFKGNTIKRKVEKIVKEPTPPLKLNSDFEDDGDSLIDDDDDVSVYSEKNDYNDDPDLEDSAPLIIDETL